MIRAKTMMHDKPLRLNYLTFPTRRGKGALTRNKVGFIFIGEYIGKTPKCDGGDLCGHNATHIITMMQHHALWNYKSSHTTTVFRNFMLLCSTCLELYQQDDTMIGEPIELATEEVQN